MELHKHLQLIIEFTIVATAMYWTMDLNLKRNLSLRTSIILYKSQPVKDIDIFDMITLDEIQDTWIVAKHNLNRIGNASGRSASA